MRVPDGDAATPAFTFTSDLNSGFYRIGADNVGLSLGGTKRWDFGTAGSSLTGTLTVSGAVTASTTLTATGAATMSSTLDVVGLATFTTYLQGTTGNGFIDFRGDSGATSGLRLLDTGNFLIAHTDGEAWDSGHRAIEFPRSAIMAATANGNIYMLHNVYYDGAAFKYKSTAAAAAIWMDTGEITMRAAGSGTADNNISFTEAININTSAAVKFPGIGTTGTAANAFLDSTTTPANNLLRSTSSLEFKDWRDLPVDEAWGIVDGMRAIAWRSKIPNDKGRHFVGLGAEHVAEADERFAILGDGKPDGVMYAHFVAPLALAVRDLKAQVAELRARAA
jgi:hypothetical protein